MTPAQVEAHLEHLMAALEDATEAHADVCRRAAIAEADYRREKAIATVALIEHQATKMTADERGRRVEVHVAPAHKAYLLTAAEREANREALTSIRTRIEALRTLNANVRFNTR